MKIKIAEISQKQAVKYLRVLYPLWTILGLFSLVYVPTTLVNSQDVAATVNNILANEMLFRASIAGGWVVQLLQILVVLVLYQLFKPVSKNHAVLMVVFALVGVPITMLLSLTQMAALHLLKGAEYLTALEPTQVKSLAMMFINLGEQGMSIPTIFWGLWLLPLGWLIKMSGYFAKILGMVVILAGVAYTLEPFVSLLLPTQADGIISVLDILVLGEVVFMAWLVVKGAKLPEVKSKGE